MQRPAAFGFALLAFLAGFMLAVTLALGYRSTDTVAVAPTPTIGPCSAEMERAYEITRFAQYSHVPWLNRARTEGKEWVAWAAQFDHDGLLTMIQQTFDPIFQQWWIDHYGEVMATMETLCRPDPAYPNLKQLPGTWQSYPPRLSTEAEE